MFNSPSSLGVALALCAGMATAGPVQYDGIGRAATPAEVRAWDIDVRPDFKGLPPGRGTVAQGQVLWEAKCASCHGVFGESNEVFTPLIGGTTVDDIRTGHVANLRTNGYPGRTMIMKASQVSTLWDYINRAMPWTAPKSLAPDEVYAVTAYLLSLADVLPADGELSDKNIAAVQRRLPNRHGKTTAHAMWPGAGIPGHAAKPDARGSRCMTNCATEPKVASLLPDHARNAHGNLAAQQRLVGPQRGVDSEPRASGAPAKPSARPVAALLGQYACLACHQLDSKVVGPALREVAAKYKDRPDARDYFAAQLKSGSSGIWGSVPMPPQQLPEADLAAIAAWLADGAKP